MGVAMKVSEDPHPHARAKIKAVTVRCMFKEVPVGAARYNCNSEVRSTILRVQYGKACTLVASDGE